MKAKKIDPSQSILKDWKTIDDLVDDVATLQTATSSHPQYIQVKVTEGGIVFVFDGLIERLSFLGLQL